MHRTLNTHRAGGFITSRGYRQSKARGLSSRRLRDECFGRTHPRASRRKLRCLWSAKVWHALRRQRIDIGREQTARLMRLASVAGKPKGSDNRPDMVNRDFTAHRPNQLWVGRYYLRANPERLCVHRLRYGCVLPPHCRLGLV